MPKKHRKTRDERSVFNLKKEFAFKRRFVSRALALELPAFARKMATNQLIERMKKRGKNARG